MNEADRVHTNGISQHFCPALEFSDGKTALEQNFHFSQWRSGETDVNISLDFTTQDRELTSLFKQHEHTTCCKHPIVTKQLKSRSRKV